MAIEMKVSQIALDPLTNMPIVVLREVGGERGLPIWIGLLEASAIATRLEGVELSRPMTHDLLKSALEVLGATIDRITVVDLRDNTFFATIRLRVGDGVHELDSRPSDALALALRAGSSIYVEESVLEASRQMDEAALEHPVDVNDREKVEEFLRNLPSDVFGKYKM